MPVKSTALKAVLSFVAAGYKREGSDDKKEMYKNTKNIRKRTYTWQQKDPQDMIFMRRQPSL